MKKIATIGNVKVYWCYEWREFQCKLGGVPDATYFTNDKEDALATAEAMDLEHRKYLERNKKQDDQSTLTHWSNV
jgi:hypothetical protein